jgi:hypothetical protein
MRRRGRGSHLQRSPPMAEDRSRIAFDKRGEAITAFLSAENGRAAEILNERIISDALIDQFKQKNPSYLCSGRVTGNPSITRFLGLEKGRP